MSRATRYSVAGMIGQFSTRYPLPSGLEDSEFSKTSFRLSTVSDRVSLNDVIGSRKILAIVEERVSILLHQ